MDVGNIWRKGRNYKGKGKGKGNYKGSKSKGKDRSKGHYKGFDKGSKTKEDTTRAKEKATQDPKDMDQAKATKEQIKGKGNNNYTTCHRCGKPGHWAQDCRVPVWHIGEGEELHPLEQEQADHDNNEELPQDVNDTWDWYYEGEEGQHEVNYTEEN